MTAIQVDTVIVVEEQDVLNLFKAFENAVSPTALEYMLATSVAPWLQHRAEQRFNTEGDLASGKWNELRPATNLIRLLLGYSPVHPINLREGDLHRFVTHSGGTVSPVGDGAELTWPGPGGAQEEKLKVAQQGSPSGENPWFKSAKTAARPVVAIDQADVAALLVALNGHLMEHMQGVGFTVNPI